ncbi:MAG: hypothetical protein K2K22_05565 [Muribaculaceae bacterium]|nr:hypothetical protein [Muribaculaceae bacterium]MDE6612013.1 hypothetical protein [Muribaculaceae bacterium]
MTDITEIFISIIEEAPGIDMAEAEFRRRLVDEPELRKQYKEYCREQGSSERSAFTEFCEDYCSTRNSVWDSLNDYDNQE